MKKIITIIGLFLLSVITQATEHHSGHAGMGGGGGSNCIKAKLAKFSPEHLATVAPGSEFSFVVYNIDYPNQVHAMVKEIPVELTAEFKDPIFIMKGKLPESLRDTVVRINIKVSAKLNSCEAENGWLLKVAQ